MAKDQTRRLSPKVVQADKDVVSAVASLLPVYTPPNVLYTLVNLQAAQAAMTSAQALEVQLAGQAAAARDTANAKEWLFHNMALEAKKQVQAQYGSDSDQVQSIGLKRKSEYKKPVKKPKAKP